MKLIRVSTAKKIELKDITDQINAALGDTGLNEGVCLVFCPHTTAGIVVNENADPDVRRDLERAFEKCVPDVRFDHAEGNSPAHFLSCLTGPSVMVPFESGRLKLGTWQGVFFCEYDGPRTREVWVQAG
jgi:secondary thiamine-phosphate synthase enzyme